MKLSALSNTEKQLLVVRDPTDSSESYTSVFNGTVNTLGIPAAVPGLTSRPAGIGFIQSSLLSCGGIIGGAASDQCFKHTLGDTQWTAVPATMNVSLHKSMFLTIKERLYILGGAVDAAGWHIVGS